MTIAIGVWISLPGLPRARASGTRASPARQRGHQDRRQPLHRPRSTASRNRHALDVLQVPDVGDHHHAVAGGDAEQRDEAHQRGHRQHAAGDEDPDHAADERQRQVDHDQQRVAGRPKATKSSRKMPTITASPKQSRRSGVALGALELAAVFDAVALRQSHLAPRLPARMSSTTLPRSRPATLAMTTILRCTFSRVMVFGPGRRGCRPAPERYRAPTGVAIERVAHGLEVGAGRRR